jgi:hypothetical protein
MRAVAMAKITAAGMVSLGAVLFLWGGGGAGLANLLAKFVLIGGCVWMWFLSQKFLSGRGIPVGDIVDFGHRYTEGVHRILQARPDLSRRVLIWSSAGVDLFGIYLIGLTLFGESISPFLALVMLFVLRQISQIFCLLPAPPGMIWKDTGVPTLLVTYDTHGDFFFSGHTAISILGAIFACLTLPWWGGVGASVLAVGEILAVLALRAHYTMDVICGVTAAGVCFFLAKEICHVAGL